jgi:DNA-binding CsgD family transcriptional regulator
MESVLGRDEQSSRVGELLTSAASGQRAALLVDGAPGTGRTTLLRTALASASMPVATNLPGAGVDLTTWLADPTPGTLVAVDDYAQLPARVRAAVSAAPAAGWLLTGRDRGDFTDFTDFTRAVPTTTTTLGPLTPATVRALVADALGAAADPVVLALVNGTGGNPLLLTVVLAGLRAEGVRRLTDRAETPQPLRELVRRRLRSAPVESWRLLRVAAVLGRTCQLGELAAMTRQTTAQLLPTVDALLDDGVLDWDGDDLVFRHEVVWWAVLDALPRAVHNALLDDRDRIRGAATPTATCTNGPLVQPGGPLFSTLPAGTDNSGRTAGTGGSDLHCLRANLLLLKGESAAARAAADRVLARPGVHGRAADQATAARLTAMALARDPESEQAAEQVLATSPPASTAAVAAALVLSNVWWAKGQLEDALRMARHRANVGAGGMSPHWWLWQRLALINKLGVVARLDEANALMRTTRAEMSVLNLQSYEGNRAIVESHLLLVGGRRAAAADRATTGVAAARQAGIPLLVPFGLCVLASVALAADDLDTAAARLAESAAVLAAADCVATPLHSWVSLRLAARRHGPRRAATMAVAELATGSPLLVAEPGAAAWLVRIANKAGDQELARRVVGTAERLAVANPGFPTLAAAASEARGNRPAAAERAATTWESLSSVERAIAALVAQGMTNRQIATRVRLSPHTVNYHLRGMFRKLDVSSRAELVRHVPNAA